MLIDFIEIPNVFDNPDEIVNLAKREMYVLKEAHYHNVNHTTHYNGVRSKGLEDIDKDKFYGMMDEIFSKCMKHRFINDMNKVKFIYGWEASGYFHIMREQDKYNDQWMHKDDLALLAGVVYLNPNPKPNTGTIVNVNGEERIVKNEYNKLVMYDTNFWHAPQGGFGEDTNDSRLSFVFFINDFKMQVRIDKEKDEK
jgi:hypothetical protein